MTDRSAELLRQFGQKNRGAMAGHAVADCTCQSLEDGREHEGARKVPLDMASFVLAGESGFSRANASPGWLSRRQLTDAVVELEVRLDIPLLWLDCRQASTCLVQLAQGDDPEIAELVGAKG